MEGKGIAPSFAFSVPAFREFRKSILTSEMKFEASFSARIPVANPILLHPGSGIFPVTSGHEKSRPWEAAF
jgi:hypothetical protein